MKVLHFILGKAAKDRANGVNQVIAGLAKYSARLGAEIRVIGKAKTVSHEGEYFPRDGFAVEAYSRWGARLRAALDEGIRWADIVHLHGMYSPWNIVVARMCDARDRPYIVTLHDGLAPERSLSHGRFRKKIFHTILQGGHLERAAGVHVLTEEEATDVLAVARPSNIFCIPNGIDLEDYPPPDWKTPLSRNEINIGYLGRLSMEKNIEALCQAFSSVNANGNMRLKLAGPSSPYGESLLKRFAPHGVIFVGPKFGEDKTAFIESLDFFIHPSLCDVFSIAAMEVLALGTPLLITRTSKASYFYDRNSYFMCEPTSFGLERGLRMALDRRMEWQAKAANGRRLIEERLNWHAAAKDMLEVYGRIARK